MRHAYQLRRGIRQRFCGRCNALTWVPFHDFSNHCNLDLWSGQGFKRKRSKILKRSNCSFRTAWAFSITKGVAFKSPTKRSKEGGWGKGHWLFLWMYFPKINHTGLILSMGLRFEICNADGTGDSGRVEQNLELES